MEHEHAAETDKLLDISIPGECYEDFGWCHSLDCSFVRVNVATVQITSTCSVVTSASVPLRKPSKPALRLHGAGLASIR